MGLKIYLALLGGSSGAVAVIEALVERDPVDACAFAACAFLCAWLLRAPKAERGSGL